MGTSVLERIKNGLVVSCQAREGNPLRGPQFMLAMAQAAALGGAVGIRAEGEEDIRTIKEQVPLPLIGLIKRNYPDSPVYITPTAREVKQVLNAGADIVAIDATDQVRPGQRKPASVRELVDIVHRAGKLAMADISTRDEALRAETMGFDLVGTTLSGYTPYSPKLIGPDLPLVQSITTSCRIPVIAEGRYWTPEEVKQALELGAWAVVVGTAITNPWLITQRFVSHITRHREERSG